VGDLRHKQIFIPSLNAKRQVEDNSSTVITIAGTLTGATSGLAYEIRENTTIVNAAIAFPATAFGGATANFTGFILASNDSIGGTGLLGIESITFAGLGRGISLYSMGGATINNCRFTTTVAGIELGRSGSALTVSDCDFQGTGVFFSQSTVGPRRVTFRRNVSDGASACFQSDQAHATLNGNSCRNSTLHHVRWGNALDLDVNGDHYDTSVGACLMGNMLSTGMSSGSVIVRNTWLRNCLGGGIFAIGPVMVDAATSVNGNGLGSSGVTNSAGITLQNGARMRIGSLTYLDGGSTVPDIDIDGTLYQWAAFRALGPPINYTDAATGSRLWNP
jgi:hypothetical protein